MNEHNDIFGFDTPSGILDSYEPDTIDTIDETADAIEDIIDDADADTTDTSGESQQVVACLLAQHYAYMEKRVRLLTWAVIALAAFIVAKELA